MALRRLANQDDDRDQFPVVLFLIGHIGGTFLAVFFAGLMLLLIVRWYVHDAARTAADKAKQGAQELQKEIDQRRREATKSE